MNGEDFSRLTSSQERAFPAAERKELLLALSRTPALMSSEHIGKIERMRVPWIEEQERKLEGSIASNSELQARIRMLQNPSLDKEAFFKMIESWNRDHKEWEAVYVEKAYQGVNGQVLRIRMDQAGNVRLAGG